MPEIKNKIIYLANVRLPTEKAHGIQIVRMCEAFAGHGVEVELIVPNRLNSMEGDIFNYYGVKKNFVIKKLPCIDFISRTVWLGPLAYWVESMTFAWSLKRYLKNFSGIVYTRELSNIAFLGNNKIVYEAHNLPNKPHLIFRHWLGKINNIVAITQGLKDDLASLGFSLDNILVASDGVDLKKFDVKESVVDCRKKLNLPLDKKIIMYAGHLYNWKGADTLLAAAKLLPEFLVVFIGGTEGDVERFKKLVQEGNEKNVLILGHKPVADIPGYLKSSDVLVLPNSAKQVISARFTSPLKLFEYMASKRPIVASNLPSLREVLDEEIATFFEPDNYQSLAESIKSAIDNQIETEKKTGQAYSKVQDYTWEKRVEKIVDFLKLKN